MKEFEDCSYMKKDYDELVKASLESQALAELDRRLNVAIGALADIAFSEDMNFDLARRKAARIYEELQP